MAPEVYMLPAPGQPPFRPEIGDSGGEPRDLAYGRMPHGIASDKRLSPTDRIVVMGLLHWAWHPSDRCTVSDWRLANYVGVSEATIRRSLATLERVGLIRREEAPYSRENMTGRTLVLVWISAPDVVPSPPSRDAARDKNRCKHSSPVSDPAVQPALTGERPRRNQRSPVSAPRCNQRSPVSAKEELKFKKKKKQLQQRRRSKTHKSPRTSKASRISPWPLFDSFLATDSPDGTQVEDLIPFSQAPDRDEQLADWARSLVTKTTGDESQGESAWRGVKHWRSCGEERQIIAAFIAEACGSKYAEVQKRGGDVSRFFNGALKARKPEWSLPPIPVEWVETGLPAYVGAKIDPADRAYWTRSRVRSTRAASPIAEADRRRKALEWLKAAPTRAEEVAS